MHSPDNLEAPPKPEPTLGAHPPRRWLRDVGWAVAIMATIGILMFLFLRPEPLPEGISASEFERAERLFFKTYGKRPHRRDVFSYLGELSAEERDWNTALVCFRQIPSDDPKYGRSARLQEAEILLDLNRASQAEERLREFLALALREPRPSPGSLRAAYERLAYILSVELRFEDRKPILAEMHALGIANVNESKQYYFPNLLIWRSSTGRHRLREFLAEEPAHWPLHVAQGRYLTAEGKLDEARSLLETLCAREPENLEAASALLECCYEAGDQSSLAKVLDSLPPSEADEPWLLVRMRGELALATQRFQDAISHFQSVLESDPANPECHMGLAKAYEALRQTDKRDETLRHSEVLARIRVFLSNVTEEDAKACLELAAMCEEIELREAAQTYRKHAERISGMLAPPASPVQGLKADE